MHPHMISCIDECYSIVNFVVLINGLASDFFKPSHGLKQGCRLSPLLFLLVAYTISRLLYKGKDLGNFQELKITNHLIISHILFVDGTLIVGPGSMQEARVIDSIRKLSSSTTGMPININKSMVCFHLIPHARRLASNAWAFKSKQVTI